MTTWSSEFVKKKKEIHKRTVLYNGDGGCKETHACAPFIID